MRVADPEITVQQQIQLLQILRNEGSLTRSELSQYSGYSVSQIRQLSQGLLNKGLIIEGGMTNHNSVGRPSQRWKLAPKACIAVGLDVGGTYTRLTILDTCGNILHRHVAETIQAESGELLLDYLAQTVRQELTNIGLTANLVSGMGVAFSGFIDYRHGASIDAPNIASAYQLPLQTYLEQTLSMPVLVEDSSRTMTLAEMRYGAGRSISNFLCINVGTGIGMGIINEGKLMRGEGLAGEIGHIPMQIYGERCRCGSQGCLETLASGNAIAAKARHMLEQRVPSILHEVADHNFTNITAKQISEAAIQGDQLAINIMQDAGNWLGAGVATVINLFSPEKVILTGGVMRQNELLLDVVRTSAARYALPQILRPLPIVPTTMDEYVAAIGAATLILDDAFEHKFADFLLAA